MSEAIHEAITSSIAGLDGAGDNGGVAVAEAPPEAPAAPAVADPPPAAPAAPAPSEPAPAAPATPPADPTKPIIPEAPVEPGEPKSAARMPLHRHETIISGLRTAHQQEIAKVKADSEAQLGEARQQLQLLEIADRDPARFLDALVRADPRYEQLIVQRATANGHAPAPAAAAAPVAAEMPQPDATMADGTPGYTLDGLKALMAWNASQVEQRLLKQVGPVLEDHQAREATRGALQRVTAQVEQAQAWEGFNEHQKEIGAALRADRRLTLEGAYRQVVIPRLKANRDTMRAELLAEINGKPLKMTNTSPAGAPPPSATSDDLQSIIRASIANMREH